MSAPTLEDLIGIEHCKLGFYQDLQQKVEQLKTTNLKLEKKRQEMQAVLDGITDLMLVLSDDLRILRVNHVVNKRYPDVDPTTLHCYELLRKRKSPCPDCPVRKALDNRQVVKERSSYRVGNGIKHFEIIASPLKSDPTGERQALLFKRDVTLEKEYQDKFYQAEKMATVGTLAAGVAHEINNPLAAISGFAEGLQRKLGKLEQAVDKELADDFREYTATIMSECLRCRDIVRTLLTFSRPVGSRLSTVDMNKCVNDTLFILKHHFKDRHGVTVETDLGQDLPVILGDESQLKQVIINLITNAFDATGEGGRIDITTRTGQRGTVELIVEDTGCGIPWDIQDKLFEPFFSTKQVGQGIGIGLSMCYSIVQNHHGEIFVCSDAGKGASFKVTLPGEGNDD
ncbi:ATP-binding protein [Desulfopila sp. IMCC35008]|uniref:PAS domain-containing sensor histidine kinase n=1 Tax=Desulfopila sp. IMCC35008 TaxID=2653858 RepID=UPI0013D467B5|nr:ATP-binding protein [Desulfopila sp. IMCC35008]